MGFADEPAHDVSVTSSVLLVEGKVWDVRRDRFEFGGTELVRDYVDHTGVVAILALDEEDRVLLLKQYRHPIAHRDWEIPAGLMDVAGESPLAGAKRELTEEADLVADEWHVLAETAMSPGGSSEVVRIFLARGLRVVEHDYVRSEEEAEMVAHWEPLDAVVDAVLAGRVQNSITVVAALTAAQARARDWSTLRPADAPWDRREATRGRRSAA